MRRTHLQASTSEVYGDPEIHPQIETYKGHVNTMGPRACHDEGKRCAETLCFDYHQQHGVPIKVVRIFNTYGPRMDPLDGRVISNVIVKALQGDDIAIYGDGCQTRSFCFVDDMIDGFVRMMASSDDFIGPVNLGNPEELTIHRLVDLVIEATGSRSKIVFLPLPQDDPSRRRPDITLAQNELDWSPTMPLKKGLAETIAYFEQLLCGNSMGWVDTEDECAFVSVSRGANQETRATRFPGTQKSQLELAGQRASDDTKDDCITD